MQVSEKPVCIKSVKACEAILERISLKTKYPCKRRAFVAKTNELENQNFISNFNEINKIASSILCTVTVWRF